nr:hypothetical protein CFP56_54471 [Quercus suber]
MPSLTNSSDSYDNSAGTGFGNKTTDKESSFDTSDTRLGSSSDAAPYSGATQHGSGTTAGVGFGNKTSSDGDVDTSDTRLGSSGHTGAYTSGTQYGSGSTGGAGFGNKHTNAKSIGDEKNDSTMGKLYEKAGGMLKNEGIMEKGRQKREEAGAFEKDGSND